MKTCPGCRTIHPDEYAGDCPECGKGLGGVSANGGQDLTFRYANQNARIRSEAAQEQRLKRGDSSGLRLEDSLVDVANRFILVDEEKLKQVENA